MKKLKDLVKRIGIWKILFAIATAMVSFGMLGYMVYHICFRQVTGNADSDFFRGIWDIKQLYATGTSFTEILEAWDYNIWAVLIAIASTRLGIHPLVLCHTVLPIVFLAAMTVIYLYLGIRFFSMQSRGRYYTVVASLVFYAAFIYLAYLCYYSKYAPEAGIYMNPYRGFVVAGILVVPLIMSTILRIVKRIRDRKDKKYRWFHILRDVVILLVEVCMLMSAYSLHVLYRLSNGVSFVDIFTEYYKFNWFMIAALILLVAALVLRTKGIIPVAVTLLITALLGVPAPVAIITSLGITALIFSGEKYSIWHFAAYYMVFLLYLVGWLEGTTVNYRLSFNDIENDYRIDQSVVDTVDYIAATYPESTIASSSDIYGLLDEYYGESPVADLGEAHPDRLSDTFHLGLQKADIVVLSSSLEPSEAVLLDNEFIPEKTFGDMCIYRRTYWELIDGKWAHRGLNGDYLRDGWYKIDGNFYYMNSDGLAETGWLKWEGNNYYLDESGKMAMFWQEIDDKWYYFGSDGIMLSNINVDGYDLGADGALIDK